MAKKKEKTQKPFTPRQPGSHSLDENGKLQPNLQDRVMRERMELRGKKNEKKVSNKKN